MMLAGSDGKAHQTDVKVGITNKEFAQVLSGVKEGDPIITAGSYALPDKTKITIETASPPGETPKDTDNKDDKSNSSPAGNSDSGSSPKDKE